MADEQDAPEAGDDPEAFLRSILDKGDDGTGAAESALPADDKYAQLPMSQNIEDRRTTLNDDPSQPGRHVDYHLGRTTPRGWDTLNNAWHFADGGAVPEEAPPDDGWAPVDQPAAQAAAPPQDDGWAPVDKAPADDGWASVDAPQPEGVAKTIGRKVLNDAIPFAGSIPAMVEGAGLGAAAGIPLDPFTLGGASLVGGFLGGAAGGLGAGWLLTAAQDKIKSVLGLDDSEQRQVNAGAHSTAEMVADIGEMAAGFKVGKGLNIASRVITAGGMGGLDAAQQLAATGTVDPKEVAEQAALGAVFNEPRSKRLADPFGRHTPAAPTPGRPDLQGDQSAKDDAQVAPPPAGAPGVAAEHPKPTQRQAGDAIGGDDGFRAVGSETDLAKDTTPKSNAETVTQGDIDPATQAALDSMAKPRPTQKPLTPPPATGLPEAAQAAVQGRPPRQGKFDISRPGNAEGGFAGFDQAQSEATPAPGEVPPSAQQATDPSKPFLPNVQVERAPLPAGYVARSDNAGRKVYISENMPDVLNVNGHQVPVDDALKVHELFERNGIAVLQEKIAAGEHPPMSDDQIYAAAHEHAGTAAERAYLEEHVGTKEKPFTDADFAEYQRQMTDLSRAQKGAGQPPADLYKFMDTHEGKLHLHTPDPGDVTGSTRLNEVLPGDAKAQAEFEGKAAPEDKFAAALRDFHSKPGDVTATVIPGLKPALKLIAEHPGLRPEVKAEMTAKLNKASPEEVARVYEGLRPKVRAKVKVGTDEIQVRPANRARVEKITGAVRAGFERSAPKDDKLPVGKTALDALKARLQDGVDHATSEAGVDPFAPATYAEGDTKKRNATGGGYRPAKLPAEYQWLRAAKEALKGNMTEAKAQKFLAKEKVLRSGNVEAVDEARADHRAEADKDMGKNGGDEAVERAEGRTASVDPYAEEDAMIERLDAARNPDAFDTPHEEGAEGRTTEPITSKEDLEKFAAKADQKPFDLSKMTPEEIGKLAEDMAKGNDDKVWKNAEEERIAKIAEKSANLKALRLARAGAVPLRPEVEKRARFAWSEGQTARGARPTKRPAMDMGASDKILKNLGGKYPDAGSWINRPPGQLIWRNPIVKDPTKKLGVALRSPTTRKGAAEEQATRAVGERLNMLDQSKAARNTWLNGPENKGKLKAMGATDDDLERLYHAIENKTVNVLPERIKAMYHQVVQPLLTLADTFRDNALKIDPTIGGTDVQNYIKRIARNYMQREDLRAGEVDPITGVRGVSLSKPEGGKERAFQALTNTATGERTVISPADGGYTTWRNGQAGTVKDPDFKFKEGELYTKGKVQYTMDQARTAEIMQHAKDDLGRKMDYHTNAFDSAQLAVREWGDVADALQHMENMKQSQEFKALATLDKAEADAKGWQKLGDGGPKTFQKYYMDAHLKEQMEQYSRPGIWGVPDALRNFAQGLTKTIYWTPTTHIFNHAATWFMGRGWDNFTPAGMHSALVDGAKAIRAVAMQDATYQRLQRAGLKLEFAPMMDSHFMEQTMDRVRGDMAARPQKWEKIAKVFGAGVPELSDAIYHQSNKALWSASDVFTIQRALELERKGLTTPKAIDETHKYIPSYRIPSRIMTGGNGGAFLAKLVTEPTAVVFGRYHWAVMNGLAHMVRDLTSGEGKRTLEGVGHLMALGMLAYFVKPALDKAAQLITGNKAAEVRPFGPLTMPEALVKAGKAQSDPQQALRDAATLSPMAETALNLYHNRDFTGRKIIEPGDVSKAAHGNLREAGKVAVQAGVAAARGTIAPLNSAMNSGQDGVAGMVRDQMLSIKNPSPAAQKFLRQAQVKGDSAANARERKPPNAIEKAYDRLTK